MSSAAVVQPAVCPVAAVQGLVASCAPAVQLYSQQCLVLLIYNLFTYQARSSSLVNKQVAAVQPTVFCAADVRSAVSCAAA